MAAYEERYVCFIDILGFSSATKDQSHPCYNYGPDFLRQALRGLRSMGDPDMALIGVKLNQFSDCVALSSPILDQDLHMFLLRTMNVQQYLIRGKLPTRGAITKGLLYHDDSGCIFGPALVEAVELEKKYAKFPRVILAPNVLGSINFNTSSSLIGYDSDFSYVKYIENWCSINTEQEIASLGEFISNGLTYEDKSKRAKYEWLDQKYKELIYCPY